MGIKGLTSWIKKHAPDAIELLCVNDLKGKRVAIDTSTVIYRTVLALRYSNIEMKNNKGELTSHLYGIFFKTIKFLENDMIPVYVFDGRSPESKQETLNERRKRKEEAQAAIDSGNLTEDEIRKLEQRTFFITQKMKHDLQTMLTLGGIPWIEADGEADPLLAYLNREGYVDGVIADDTDISVFGAPHQYKGFLDGMKSPNRKIIQHIQYHKILEKLGWNRDRYIKLALLLGSDHAPSLKGIGPISAHKLAVSKDNIETIAKQKYSNGEIFRLAHTYFKKLTFSDRIYMEIDTLKLGPVKTKALYTFLVDENQFESVKVINAIKKISPAIRRIKEKNL
jgi:flap endonuclease-1